MKVCHTWPEFMLFNLKKEGTKQVEIFRLKSSELILLERVSGRVEGGVVGGCILRPVFSRYKYVLPLPLSTLS